MLVILALSLGNAFLLKLVKCVLIVPMLKALKTADLDQEIILTGNLAGNIAIIHVLFDLLVLISMMLFLVRYLFWFHSDKVCYILPLLVVVL